MAWAGWLFDFYDLILYTFLLGEVGKELGLDRGEQAQVLAFSLGSTAIGGMIFGWLADRFGRKAILQTTILTYSAGALMTGLSPSLGWLVFSRIVTGRPAVAVRTTEEAEPRSETPRRTRTRTSADAAIVVGEPA